MFRVIAPLLLVGLAPASAAADSPYTLNLRVDLPLIALGGAGSMTALIEVPPAACLPDCSPDGINALDRTALGHYSASAYTAANVGVAALMLTPLVLDGIDSGGDGWIEDTAVFAQALLLTQTMTQLLKFAVRRPAPLVYDPDVPDSAKRGRDASRSFISGHTSMAFAAATSYAVTFWLRHPDSAARWVVIGAGAAVALAVGLLKVAAGYHFWTDIAAGALVGAGTGALVPLLHAHSD
jgi:membrane-associated phospholipid phosphatase